MTTIYHGQADVASWCGAVSASVVSNWIRRHPDTSPAPDVLIVNESTGRDFPVRGWLPERRPEWEKFAADRNNPPGATEARTAGRRNRKAAEMIYQSVQEGKIDPDEGIKLLHELI